MAMVQLFKAAACGSKLHTRRTEVTTNMDYERVRIGGVERDVPPGIRKCATRLRGNVPKIG